MRMILFRSIERILALFIGALSIYLGYRLFIKLSEVSVELSSGQGSMDAWGMKVTLSHVGPGVFFALFGAIVVWLSVRMQMKYESSPGPETITSSAADNAADEIKIKPGSSVAIMYLASTERIADEAAVESARARLRRDFRAMEEISSVLETVDEEESVSIDEDARTDFIVAVPRLKEALMLSVWDDDWGDYSNFAKWRRAGCKSPLPKDIITPANFYLGKE